MLRSCCHTLQTGILAAGACLSLVTPLSMARALPPSFQAIMDCQRVANDKSRLACYDRAAASLGQHALAAPQWKSSSDSRPDFDPGKPFHQEPPKAELPPDRVTLPLVSIGNSDGKAVFYLSNGQIWRDQNDDFVYVEQSRRNTATIKKSMLGLGYLLMINESEREISVKRVK